MQQIQNNNSLMPSVIISEIKKEIGDGYGILPLIGAGMSAASGIPAGHD
jgi:hypothetical protein